MKGGTNKKSEVWDFAAETGNQHLAFMRMAGLSNMFHAIQNEVDIARYDVLCAYDAQDLCKTAKAYDDITNAYLSGL